MQRGDIQQRLPFHPEGGGVRPFAQDFYDTAFDPARGLPLWTVHRLTPGRTMKKFHRDGTPVEARGLGGFRANPDIAGTPPGDAYDEPQYDAGHMVPAEAMQFDRGALADTFYTSNVCPQCPGLNRGPWRTLERHAFDAARERELVIVCGPVFIQRGHRLPSGVAIPDAFFKVIADPEARSMICYVMPNSEHVEPCLETHYVNLRQVEHLSGLRFPAFADYDADPLLLAPKPAERALPRIVHLRWPARRAFAASLAGLLLGAGATMGDLQGVRDVYPVAQQQSVLVENLCNGRYITRQAITFYVHDDDFPMAAITIPEGFETDFGSVPSWARGVIEGIGTPQDLVYLLHDWVYATEYFAWEGVAYKLAIQRDLNREFCDELLLMGCKAAGVGWCRRNTIWLAVRCGGGSVWEDHSMYGVNAARALLTGVA